MKKLKTQNHLITRKSIFLDSKKERKGI